MKIWKLLTAGALLALACTAGATTFNFTYEIWDRQNTVLEDTVTGSFDGIASGNRVTGLSNISVFVKKNIPNAVATAFWGNGNLFSGHYERTLAYDDDAVASFDGTENNFLFMATSIEDSKSADSNINNWRNAFGSTSGFNTGYIFRRGISNTETTNPAHWSLTPVTSVPEPETYAMLLAGLGVMGAVARRRKAKQA